MSDRILYLEGSSGISGDMTVSALLDLGADREHLKREIAKLPLEGYRLVIGRTEKCGIDACAFFVEMDAAKPQPARNYRQIRQMLEESQLDPKVKERALAIFGVLAEAEAAVHGTTPEQVHFHEVGAVDSIIDIVGAAVCLEDLGAEKIAIGTLREGQGTSWCQHGRMPVPVPATAQLIARYHLAVKITDTQGEMITPTGAAIAAACGNCRLPEEFVIEKIGIGSGEKDFTHANILRAMWVRPAKEEEEPKTVSDAEKAPQESGDAVWVLETNVDDCTGEQLGYVQERLLDSGALDACYLPVFMKKSRPAREASAENGNASGESARESGDTVWVLETNVDDCTGEQLGYVQEQLLEEGALDACYLPVFMKKSRPAWQLQVLCRREDMEKLEHLIFRETTTIGIRRYPVQRTVLPRRMATARTPWGNVRVKVCSLGEEQRGYPEYEDVKALSLAADVPFGQVYREAEKAWK